MAAAMAPTIAEFAMILLADDEVVVVELDGGPVVVDVVSELVETRGLVVVVLF
jgi:ABC-type lipoprotein export system ATPase subunit